MSDEIYMRASPSRTYVAACFRGQFAGYFFKKFVLPEKFKNDSGTAIWYYLNRIDALGCVDGCFTFEDFSDISEVKEKLKGPRNLSKL